MFIPAPGHVEIKPIKEETISIDPNQKYEEMGTVIALPSENLSQYVDIHVGDTIFFDSYACRATPEIDDVKHYVVNVVDGGLLGIVKANVGE